MPYTEVMREYRTYLSAVSRVCTRARLQKLCGRSRSRVLDMTARVVQNSPLLRFSASPLLRFSASPLRTDFAHPPHTSPFIRNIQYKPAQKRTKDVLLSPVRFLFSRPIECTIKSTVCKTFCMEEKHRLNRFFHCNIWKPNERFHIHTCLPLPAGFLGQSPKQCEEEGWGHRGRKKPLP